MRFLLDTHLLLWSQADEEKLPPNVLERIESPETEVLFSAASIWEIAIKFSLGRKDFRFAPEVVFAAVSESGFVELPVYSEVAKRVARMPFHHRDPFDRLLVAQAMSESIPFYTADSQLKVYSELVELV